MNITEQIIITDTNIITDLNNAKLLDKFIQLDNVFISDMIKNDEINHKTGNLNIIKKFKIIESTPEQLLKMSILSKIETKLSPYDLINYVIAKENNYIIATGDDHLKKYAESNDVSVMRTLKIIKLMRKKNIITVGEEIDAYELLIKNKNTRIPKDIIRDELNKIQNQLIQYN